jgi:hypothetical protein
MMTAPEAKRSDVPRTVPGDAIAIGAARRVEKMHGKRR